VRKGPAGKISTWNPLGLDASRRIAEKRLMQSAPNSARVAALYRYPVKGLSAEQLPTVALGIGETFPADRAFALENGPSGFDLAAPTWQPKIKFLCLMKNAKIAALSTRYDDASARLIVAKDGRTLVEANLHEVAGRAAIERFFEDYMGSEARGPVRVLEAPGHSFSDLARKVVSIINLESVRALEASIGRKVHPLRFRGNLYVEGWPAWAEVGLVGRDLEVGGTQLRLVKMIQRCAATQVDPETAARDIDVPDAIYRLTDEDDCGIYAEVTTAGRIAEGDPIKIIS
jgi:uncharacterized protein